jgi:hypothetical protein
MDVFVAEKPRSLVTLLIVQRQKQDCLPGKSGINPAHPVGPGFFRDRRMVASEAVVTGPDILEIRMYEEVADGDATFPA